MDQKILQVCEQVHAEVIRATGLFPPVASPHEALGLIDEEFREVRDEIHAHNPAKGRDTRAKMREEMLQLAAMCVRSIADLSL